MDALARACGLGTSDSLRTRLLRRTGLTPSAYRTTFSRLPGSGDGRVPRLTPGRREE